MQVYNTLTKQKEELTPREGNKLGMYVCGVTPYDHLHLGHARTFIVYDMIRRYLEHRGYDVFHVENITDVEDKIIARAHQLGEEPLALARRFADEAAADVQQLGLLRPAVMPKVSDHLPEIIELIQQLIDRGSGYEAGGSVYFDVSSFPHYGQLSGRSVDDLPKERVEHGEEKRNPRDFALWKKSKDGEPAWDSPWGPGRPGWHIECSALSMKYLGPGFDIHGGARELAFPHHENELAQSESGTGVRPFVRYWVHSGVLNVGGEKMAKSKGNFITLRELLKTTSPDTLRMLFLTAHYRSPLDYTDEVLQQASAAVSRVRSALRELSRRIDNASGQGEADTAALTAAIATARDGFHEAMDDDFNSAQALARLFDLITESNRLLAALSDPTPTAAVPALEDARQTLGELFGVLGFQSLEGTVAAGDLANELIELLLAYRVEARARKDYVLSDRIRDDLAARGVVLKDHPTGTSWHFEVS